MKTLAFIVGALFVPLAFGAAGWHVASAGWQYEFPRDHRTHGDFKTEWWYFTGNLAGDDGTRFGFELTFFREGVRPPDIRAATTSRFVVDDMKFAHFAITDISGQKFVFEQKVSRGAFGEAGFGSDNRLAWIDSWSLQLRDDGTLELKAEDAHSTLQLTLKSTKPPAIHGIDGVSRKGEGVDNASHYYSLTNLTAAGMLTLNGKSRPVSGQSWFDHEWATNQLAPHQVGWDWLSVQLTDGRELMLYRMRRDDGSVDAESSGTVVDVDGATTHLNSDDFEMTPTRFWKSAFTGGNYPIEWQVDLHTIGARFAVRATVDAQELNLKPLSYWEGAIEITGEQGSKAIGGRGYLELTGYAAPLRELTR